jgi:hypothetical protein
VLQRPDRIDPNARTNPVNTESFSAEVVGSFDFGSSHQLSCNASGIVEGGNGLLICALYRLPYYDRYPNRAENVSHDTAPYRGVQENELYVYSVLCEESLFFSDPQ